MPKFTVTESIAIDASVGRIYEIIRDFRQWKPWSPWLIAEPGCSLDYDEDGKGYSWTGEIVGSGRMRIQEEEIDSRIDYELTFLKPWKSVSQTSFDLTVRDDLTHVTWSMEGSLPFFMFWMTSMMTVYVSRDYRRGLSMLKDYAETGFVPSKLTFAPDSSVFGFKYVGQRGSCGLEDIGPMMQKCMSETGQWIEKTGAQIAGNWFASYHKFDPVKNVVDFTVGCPVGTMPEAPPSPFITGEVPSLTTYAVEHKGPYRHLGNAWAAGMMHARCKRFKQGKQFPPFEVYENDPVEVAERDILTTVHFPMR